MDVQLKRGLLEYCVLAAIRDNDSYGYRIIKDMKPFVEISESTLYPILRRLEGAELLTVRSAEHNGRLRKYYAITQRGRERLDGFAEEWREIQSIYSFIVREEKTSDERDFSRSVGAEDQNASAGGSEPIPGFLC